MLTIRRPRQLAVTVVAAVGALCVSALPAAAIHKSPPARTAASAAVGATTPFSVYEAEGGTPGGGAAVRSLTSAPTTQYSSAALEASGHSYVHLGGTGQSVRWTNTTGQPISFLNVRAGIPDSASGGGTTATLNLYVNGVFRQALNLNSRQSWVYEGNDNYNTSDNQNPADGDPRVFWDESHTFVTGSPIPAGATFALQQDSGNSAASYDVDSVDVENPPAPRPQPADSISITSCGAVSDDTPTNGAADSRAVDSRAAIQTCIDQAQQQGKTLWIPQGTFYVKGTAGLTAQGITIAGAGLWYSTVYRDVPVPNTTPLAALFDLTSCTVRDFHIDANAVSRSTVGGDGGAMDTTGTNWLADGIWTQHTMSGFWASGTGGTVENSRLTSIWADGINVNNVSLNADTGNNLTVTNNFVRGTGDDAIAINSVAYNTNSDGSQTHYNPMTDITVSNNTSIAPLGRQGHRDLRRQRPPGEEQLHQRHGPLYRPRRRPLRRQRQRPALRDRHRQHRGPLRRQRLQPGPTRPAHRQRRRRPEHRDGRQGHGHRQHRHRLPLRRDRLLHLDQHPAPGQHGQQSRAQRHRRLAAVLPRTHRFRDDNRQHRHGT